jgi:hypothetical protein
LKSCILLLALVLGGGCGNSPSPPPRFFFTCGDPVCGGHAQPENMPPCSGAQQAGQTCGPEGQVCDPSDGCNRRLICSREDPTLQPGGCPISLAAWKKDIRYLDADDLQRHHDAVVRMPLATWRYRTETDHAPPRLGFLIDDVGASPCVQPSGQRVDLYGYASMTVAAVQVQSREIAALRAEVAALRREMEGLRR